MGEDRCGAAGHDPGAVAVILERIAKSSALARQSHTPGARDYRAHYCLLLDIRRLTEEQADQVEPAFTELENLLFSRPSVVY